MFYRVDYSLAVTLAGFLAGLLLSAPFRHISPSRLARAYYVFMAIPVLLRTAFFARSLLAAQPGSSWTVAALLGDLTTLLFGAIFGLAVRRKDARRLLVDPAVLAALSLMIAFTFAMAAIGKAFSMDPMTQFFAQSGYPLSFLKFIVIAEIFGALGLLLPWSFFPALVGLSVDMFGAVVTHIHNGDPLNDSTGAIALLIRLAALGILWSLRPRSGKAELTVQRSLLGGAAIAAICLMIAIGGSIALRRMSPPSATLTSPASQR